MKLFNKEVKIITKFPNDLVTNPLDIKKLGWGTLPENISDTTWEDWLFYGEIGIFKLFKDLESHNASVTTFVRPEYKGSIFSIKLLLSSLFYTFDFLGYKKVEAVVYGFNKESLRITERFLKREGTILNSKFFRGDYYHIHHFGLFKEEFNNTLKKKYGERAYQND